jgi:hypothetical protein
MTTETATTFLVGDRVLVESINEVGIVIEGLDRGQVCVANNGTIRWREIENLTLVERAWYAPPGVAMLALTPEALEALEDAHWSLLVAHAESCYYKKECDCEKNHHILELAIAAARKEAQP